MAFINYFPNQLRLLYHRFELMMRLRPKKTHNLSEDALCFDIQNPNFQTLNRKPDFLKNAMKDSMRPSINSDQLHSTYAQILAKFITNINMAKHSQPRKSKSKSHYENILREQNRKPKRIRKTSENASFEEEKKIEHIKPASTQSPLPFNKFKHEQKRSKPSDTLSIGKPQPGFNTQEKKEKEHPEQNIINNCFMGSSFNMTGYARFIPSPQFLHNQQLMANNFQMYSFIPNIPQLTSFVQNMKNGLSRQLEIYERFKPRSSPSQIQKTPFQVPQPTQKIEQKIEKNPFEMERQSRMSPDKVFKRSSYHVAIAYSIYMNGIQKQGKKIKNFEEIDPTRFAKRIKTAGQKS